MWKFKHNSPRNDRLHKQGFLWVTCCGDENEITPMYNEHLDLWIQTHDWSKVTSCSSKPISCFRAFKKYLRKHPELRIKGVEIIFHNRLLAIDTKGEIMYSYTITAYWEEEYESNRKPFSK